MNIYNKKIKWSVKDANYFANEEPVNRITGNAAIDAAIRRKAIHEAQRLQGIADAKERSLKRLKYLQNLTPNK